MSIKSNIRREKDNEAKVVLKNLRISPQKLNLVLGMIRSEKADVAISKLQFSKKRISKDVEKALKSVISNAENNHSLDIDKLYVKEAFVGKGIVMKRFHARARGRGARILKPFSHLTIIVSEEMEDKNGSKDETFRFQTRNK